MKKNLRSCAIFMSLFASMAAHGQTFSVSFPDTIGYGAAVDSNTVSLWNNDYVTNLTPDPLELDVVRVQNDTATPGWTSSFCFQYCNQYWVDSVRATLFPYEAVNIAMHFHVTSVPDSGSVLMMYRNVADTSEVHYQRFYAFTSPAGIQNNQTATTLQLSPNPAHAHTTLRLNTRLDNGTIIVYDFSGHVAMEIKGVSGTAFVISCENLANGIYFVSAGDGKCAPAVEKLVITN